MSCAFELCGTTNNDSPKTSMITLWVVKMLSVDTPCYQGEEILKEKMSSVLVTLSLLLFLPFNLQDFLCLLYKAAVWFLSSWPFTQAANYLPELRGEVGRQLSGQKLAAVMSLAQCSIWFHFIRREHTAGQKETGSRQVPAAAMRHDFGVIRRFS